MEGCIRFWGRLDQNSGFHGNRKPPLTYNGENDVSTFSQLFLIRSFLYLQVTRTCIKFQTSSNFGKIRPLTTELAALEVLKNFPYTGDSRYVDFAYLGTITYVEVIFHSQHFFSIYLCISTQSMSKTVNMNQPVSRGAFSCPRRIFYYICYCLCRSQKSALARASYCLLRLCICIT